MKDRWLWMLSVLSGIDDSIINDASIERAQLLANLRRRRKMKRITAFAAIAASVCIIASALFFIIGSDPDSQIYSIAYSDTVDGKELYRITYPDGRTAEFFVENAPAQDNSSNVKQVNMNEDGELLVTLKNGSVINLGKNVGKSETASANTVSVLGFTAKSGGAVALGLSNDTELDLGKNHGNSGNAPMNAAYINDSGEFVIGFVNGNEINLGRIVGKDGADGVGIDSMSISKEGNLTVILTNGTVLDLGNVKGKDGIGIAKSEINDEGELVLTYTDGNSVNLGRVVGKDGADGVGIDSMSISEEGNLTVTLTNGTVIDLGNIKGNDGIGIAKSEINDEGELVLTYTDGNSVNLGKVVGKDGADGVGISSIEITESGELNITLTDGTLLELGKIKGEDGKSAYELYCEKYGYEGTEEEWLFDLANGLLAEKIEYIVSFDTGCDAVVEAQIALKGEKITEPQTPIFPGYEFLGWFTESGDRWVFSGYPVTGEITLYAHWQIIEYKVEYVDAHGIANAVDKYTVEDEFILPTLKKDGLIFLGWRFADECFNIVDFEITESGELVITYSDSSSTTLGAVRSEDGFYGIESITSADGRITLFLSGGAQIELSAIEGSPYITETVIGESGELVLIYSDESEISLGKMFNESGELVLIPEDISIAKDGELTLVLSSGTELTLGRIEVRDTVPSPELSVKKGTTGDLTFIAEWEQIKYKISYELFGGINDEGNPNEYTVESESFSIKDPTRTGYTFNGWKRDGVRINYLTVDKGSMGDICLEATWDIETYNITYLNANYQATSLYENPTSYNVETESFVIAPLSLEGYKFLGWTSFKGVTEPIIDFTVPKGSSGDLILTAHWEEVEYEITYDLAGGEYDGAAPESYTISDRITFAIPVRENYDFVGWRVGTDTEPIRELVWGKGKTGDLNLTAVWTPISYKIDYIGLEAGAENTNPKSYTVEDRDITLLPIECPGYTFLGFTYGTVTEPTFDAVIPGGSMGDMSFTAHYEVINYSITYDLAGGISTGENPVIYTTETESFTLINPTREHYDFVGWAYIENGVDKLSANMTVERGCYGDKSFTAVWSPKEYVINYNLYGGSFASEAPKQYTLESEDITLPVAQRDGYKFLGWSVNGGEPEVLVVINTGSYGDINLVACWEIINYTLTLVANGGTVIGEYSTDFTVEDLPKAFPTVEKVDKYFTGWYTDKMCNNRISDITLCRDITVYAGFSDGTISGMEFTRCADGSYAISRYNGTEGNVKIPFTYNGKPVTQISEYAFSKCKDMHMSVNIPPNISKICIGAFEECKLRALTFSGRSSNPAESLSIHDRAFYKSGLKSVTVSANTVYIGNSAFGKCYLNSLQFENGSKIAAIGKLDGALDMELVPITRYEGGYYIGSTENPHLVHIGADANLTEAKLHPSTAVVMGFSGQTKIKAVNLPSGVRGIGADAFSGCTSLASFTAQHVVAVCDAAFENCEALSSVSFGEGLIYIGNEAFVACDMLFAMTLPTTLSIYGIESLPPSLRKIKRGPKIYSYNDLNDLSKENVWIAGSVKVDGEYSKIPIYCDSSDFAYVYDGERMHFAGTTIFEGGVFKVPEECYGIPVTSIHGLARKDNAKITEIEIPASVNKLSGKPFDGCKLEGTLVIPDTVTQIDNYVFDGLDVDGIVLPQKITDLGEIFSASLVKHITIKGNVTRIETFALSGCKNLEYVILGTQLRYIGGMPFWQGSHIVDLFYEGTQDEFDMTVGLMGSDSLAGTRLYYYSEGKPTESGNFWHYVDGVPTKW